MREACKVVAHIYDELEQNIKPGMTTWDVDQMAEKNNDKIWRYSS